MPDLAQDHTVVAPDLRGTGDSDRPEDGYAKSNQADDIRGILTALNLTGPVAVAGHDIGSMVAFAWAAAQPEDVSHLIRLEGLYRRTAEISPPGCSSRCGGALIGRP
ncbi:alpha/beta fold hydrolase [Streptomyces misionensis]|uniref:alpha/beta fold hydrolase n=1 Tax=Streptomyces misionensis TaxID=67331 RepID=UPI00396BC015